MTNKQLSAFLAQHITPHKRERADVVIAQRTRQVTFILEHIFQPHNISAAMRSAECFGIQDVHIIEHHAYQTFKVDVGVARGSADWLTLYKHDSITACIQQLKAQGFIIAATSPHPATLDDQRMHYDLHTLPIDKPIALLFGTEVSGISNEASQLADLFVTIPMVGFTESFNISVSVALCLYDVSQRLRASSVHWQLSTADHDQVLLDWYRSMVSGSAELERRFLLELDAKEPMSKAG